MTLVYMHVENAPEPAPNYFLRQTFFSNGIINEYRFTFNRNEDATHIVIHGQTNVPEDVLRKYPIDRRILINVENPLIWSPSSEFLEKMGTVVTAFPLNLTSSVKQIITHPHASWFYGMDFDTNVGLTHSITGNSVAELQDLVSATFPTKTKLLSFVCSRKGWTPGQLWRIQVAHALKKRLGPNIDLFGFGWNPVTDKRLATDIYHYSIVIENTESDDWWTEKLSDTILGYSVPIYSGARNINRYFESEIPNIEYGIPPDDFVSTVIQIMSKDYPRANLYTNRHQVMFRHNIFYFIARLIEAA